MSNVFSYAFSTQETPSPNNGNSVSGVSNVVPANEICCLKSLVERAFAIVQVVNIVMSQCANLDFPITLLVLQFWPFVNMTVCTKSDGFRIEDEQWHVTSELRIS